MAYWFVVSPLTWLVIGPGWGEVPELATFLVFVGLFQFVLMIPPGAISWRWMATRSNEPDRTGPCAGGAALVGVVTCVQGARKLWQERLLAAAHAP